MAKNTTKPARRFTAELFINRTFFYNEANETIRRRFALAGL